MDEFKSICELLESNDFESRLLGITLLKESSLKNKIVKVFRKNYKVFELCDIIMLNPELFLRFIRGDQTFLCNITRYLYKFLKEYIKYK